MKYIIFILLALSSSACYTVVDNSYLKKEGVSGKNTGNDKFIIEGTVKYYDYPKNYVTENFFPSGYILTNYQRFISLPPNISPVIYILGKIDSSYINKRVKIEGYYRVRKDNLSYIPDNKIIIDIIAQKIFIIK